MTKNGIAIVAITRRGVETALKIQTALTTLQRPSQVYAPKKYTQTGVAAIDKTLDEFLKEIYQTAEALIGVMATGIIIRAVAPHLQGKLVDPPVLGVDANGKFVISLLSGHYGGANELARQVAEGIGATPVITTASDSLGKQSVDELARILHLVILNPKSLVAVNAAVVNGERLALVLVGGVKLPADLVSGYTIETAQSTEEAAEIVAKYDAAAVVSREPIAAKFSKPVTFLKPKRVIVGVGARKEITQQQVLDAVDSALAKVQLPLMRVDGLATVDIKASSKPMVDAAQKLGFKFQFFTVPELAAVEHPDLSPDSLMVTQKIGVGGVCERAALKAAGQNPHLILKKQKLNGVTVAVAEGE
jgi:cobalt-precorrin 5A hydrolase